MSNIKKVHNNLKIDAMASTHGERKFVRQREKYSLAEKKKNLEN